MPALPDTCRTVTRRGARRRTLTGVTALAGLVGLLLSGCTSDSAQSTAGAGAPAPLTSPAPGSPTSNASVPDSLVSPDHVMVVVFENEDATDVIGSGEAPYLTSLAAAGAQFTNAHGETHPSQPNYLALFSGSTHGVEDDGCPVELDADNLGSQLLSAGLSFVGYSEGLPRPGYTGCESGDYARKHNPWVDFGDLPGSVNQPFSALPADYASLPTVSFVVPDLCNDMHDCGVATGDAWAERNLRPYADWATGHNSLLIVTFDEDSGTDDNHIATVVAGAGVAATLSDQHIDHYDLLRTIEDLYGLEPLGAAADAQGLPRVWQR
jgi:phosphatidylinositol-3-phosphatase